MPATPAGDPLLKTRAWRAIIAHWRDRDLNPDPLPCARCGDPVDRDLPYPHPGSLQVGHIVERDRARAMGWTDEDLLDVRVTQPEHMTCGSSAGATYRQAKAHPTPAPSPRRAVTSKRWG